MENISTAELGTCKCKIANTIDSLYMKHVITRFHIYVNVISVITISNSYQRLQDVPSAFSKREND